MSQSPNVDTPGKRSITEFVGVVTRAQTYKNVLYLLLAFPLGIAYYLVLTVGFTVGIGLSVLVVGLGILLGTAIGLRFIASFERTLANRLLGTTIADPTDVEKDESEGILGTVKAYLRAPSTWRGLGFVVLKFWIGVLSFVLLVTFLGTAVELLLLPAFSEGAFNIEVAGWEVARSFETTTQRALVAPLGAVLGLLGLHLLNAFAGANASIASSLLGPAKPDTGDQREPEQSV